MTFDIAPPHTSSDTLYVWSPATDAWDLPLTIVDGATFHATVVGEDDLEVLYGVAAVCPQHVFQLQRSRAHDEWFRVFSQRCRRMYSPDSCGVVEECWRMLRRLDTKTEYASLYAPYSGPWPLQNLRFH